MMMIHPQTILIVEDEKNLGDTLLEYLQARNFSCFLAKTCAEAKKIFTNPKNNVSIILMDLGLPDGNGMDLARELTAIRKGFVLLFLTAQNDPQTRLAGLEIGGNDYITKPFALKELTLRLERILKNQKELLPDELKFGNLIIWPKRYEVQDANKRIIPLGHKECSILKILLKNQNSVVGRDDIIDHIWGENSYPSNRTVDNYIVKLRKWIETDKNNPLSIHSIRGIGYKLSVNETSKRS